MDYPTKGAEILPLTPEPKTSPPRLEETTEHDKTPTKQSKMRQGRRITRLPLLQPSTLALVNQVEAELRSEGLLSPFPEVLVCLLFPVVHVSSLSDS
jgi:hypothetical protein